MAFQYRLSDVRGKPIIKKQNGEWICVYQHYSSTSQVEKALEWCEKMNSPFLSLYK